MLRVHVHPLLRCDVITRVVVERTPAAAAAVSPGVARVARRRRETVETEAGETKQGT